VSRPPKLVRDKIPDQIREEGRDPVVLHPGSIYARSWLLLKLQEEVDEYKESGDDLELVDIYEVLRALWASYASDITLESAAGIKRETAGGFDNLVVLVDVNDRKR
jgi:predicted house-cleaning noncanonical NTP pyrophosphatase (MazG superfamily)